MIRNLLYHITPMGNYLWNLQELLQRIDIFNGQKIFAIAQGEGLDSAHNLRSLLPKKASVFVTENDPKIRETASLPGLLLTLKESEPATGWDKNNITFYGHTKGATRGSNLAVHLWTQAQYHFCLDAIKRVEEELEKSKITGTFRRFGQPTHFPRGANWHYSGTFYWFRTEALFARSWQKIPKHKYGAEAYPGLMFRSGESSCLFGDKAGDLYSLRYQKKIGLFPTVK